MNFLSNFFEFVFWQDKSTWSTFTGYFSCFFQIKFTFWHKIQKIELNFVFWQVKSNKSICIYVLTGDVQQNDLHFCQQNDLHFCFDSKIQINLSSLKFIRICVLTKKKIWSIFTGYFLNFFQIKLAFLQENSSKLIWILALTWKFKWIYLNLCFDKGNQSDQYL